MLNRFKNILQKRRLELQLHFAGFDLRQVENFIDQVE